MINNTAMKEKDTIIPKEDKRINKKIKTPDPKVEEPNDFELQDKKQRENIFRVIDNLKGCLTIILAIFIIYICYCQCTQSPKSTVKPDTEIMKSKN